MAFEGWPANRLLIVGLRTPSAWRLELGPKGPRGERRDGGYQVLIGMDTRESGPWLASAVAGGLKQVGVHARFAGVITTPGVAYLTRTGPFAAGVMISASHNPYHDNGLKVISHSGYKLPDAIELELEKLMTDWLESGAEAVPAELAAGSQLRPAV